MAVDLIVRAGRVVDGLGGAPVTADIGVRSGSIVAVGRVRDRAHRVVDADGALVIPGLVALDPPVGVAGFDRNARRHMAPGITTTIEVLDQRAALVGQWEAYLRHVAGQPSLVDRVLLVDHGALRSEVMGNKIRDQLAPSPGDLETMSTLLAATIAGGFCGLRSAIAGAAAERRAIISGAVQRSRADEQSTPFLALLLAAGSFTDTEEARREAGILLGVDHGPASVVVSAPSAIDDPRVVTALLGDDPLVLLEALATGHCTLGPGQNPLALVAAHRQAPASIDLGELLGRLVFISSAFGLDDRVGLVTGRRGDLNVIDVEHLVDDLTAGVVSTMVGGVEIVSDDELTGEAPGRLVHSDVYG